MRIALVLWNGQLGGAERLNANLAKQMRHSGVDASILFLGNPAPLGTYLSDHAIPFGTLGLRRGRGVLLKPRNLAKAARSVGPDGALLVSSGYLALALRVGGYRARIVSVDHGRRQRAEGLARGAKWRRRLDMASGLFASDIEVAVSEFTLNSLRRHRRGKRLVKIYNGVDLHQLRVTSPPSCLTRDTCTFGVAGRLVEGKGIDRLLRAFGTFRCHGEVRLRIAGDGPLMGDLQALARSLRILEAVEFCGWVEDVSAFWKDCDVAVLPSDDLEEAFPMSALEAMACGRPVIASRAGGLPELVSHQVTGKLVERGNDAALMRALAEYASDPTARRQHGLDARRTCEAAFDLESCSAAYVSLFSGQRPVGDQP